MVNRTVEKNKVSNLWKGSREEKIRTLLSPVNMKKELPLRSTMDESALFLTDRIERQKRQQKDMMSNIWKGC